MSNTPDPGNRLSLQSNWDRMSNEPVCIISTHSSFTLKWAAVPGSSYKLLAHCAPHPTQQIPVQSSGSA